MQHTIHKLLLARGGITPMARRRSRLALTLAEREDISRGLASGSSLREIARGLSRATSTVSREIVRHGGRPAYRAHDADGQAIRLTGHDFQVARQSEPSVSSHKQQSLRPPN